ncbi:uncharacterized protein MONOS_15224 [Monocercomonoides exilis]|uniref:uncharacterized protein n=1 Tax=Monocercomonoides exilis TaxID=2049356 RepID=UPI00355948BB|nr:hypothetical protein MONOS_15224 [Monocercomonoides exilis]|eukprot:MONOS_15224.1-p1 / transcript=MONOS_15224.1 / gene=MONOS_15224 / organism=Monocercomonoides_exilis_PA203 / gene_product=unspecified product / transcript_product=unspecified product / location=Mono_scaffold01173:6098-7986(-) / protein_length=578 / sequence_SO=supercontig / SO=protein_coding / is_pseudo=false
METKYETNECASGLEKINNEEFDSMQNIIYPPSTPTVSENEQTTNTEFISREEVCAKMLRMMNELLSPVRTTPLHSFQLPSSSSISSTPTNSRSLHHPPLQNPTKTPSLNRILPSRNKTKEEIEKEKKRFSEDSDTETSEEVSDCSVELDVSDYSEDNIPVEEDSGESDGSEEEIKEMEKDVIKETLIELKEERQYLKNNKQYYMEKAKALSEISHQKSSSNENLSFSLSSQSFSSSASASASASASSSCSSCPTDLYFHPTKMDSALARVGVEGTKKYLQVDRIWSEATRRKHSWVERLLTTWAHKIGLEPWPLHHRMARGFVLFCGKECHYPLSSICYIIIPSIKRLNLIKRGMRLNKRTIETMKHAVRCLKYSSDVKKKVLKKEPALLMDVKRIVKFIPTRHLDKALESSLFLVAVHTGARAVTLSNVKLCHITKVIKSKVTKKLLCTIIFYRAKGQYDWGREVTIEGNEEEEKDDDPVYWLSLHIYQKTGVRLSNWNEDKDKTNLDKLIWPLTPDCMRERFKRRAETAGYPRHLFCFHSLRSGMEPSSLSPMRLHQRCCETGDGCISPNRSSL